MHTWTANNTTITVNRGNKHEYKLVDQPDGSTVFVFDPVIREGVHIGLGSYARIQHALSSLIVLL